MNIDEILHECILANGGEPIRVTKACFLEWEAFAKDNPSLCIQLVNSHSGNDRLTLMSRKVWEREQRANVLKHEQEIDRKRAQLGRERFQEFKADGLNPTIAAALACLAEQIGMEAIKDAMTKAEKQVKDKK
mgnify:CR=1 FL=1